jgi:hypothetical protein
VDHVLEVAAAGGLAALGPEDCLRAGSMSGVDTLLVCDGAVVPGVVCDESRWLAASGEVCPVCGAPTRQIAADLMPDEYLVAAKLRFPPPGRTNGS